VQNGLAYIVGNTNTTGSTLAIGTFVYVKGHSTIAEGLRKVTVSISANGSITTNNTEACTEGGLNALNSKIDNNSIGITDYISTTHEKSGKYAISGKIVCLSIEITLTGNVNAWSTFATITKNLPNVNGTYVCFCGNAVEHVFISAGGNIQLSANHNSGDIINLNLSYVSV
jgi:hypothetical protein